MKKQTNRLLFSFIKTNSLLEGEGINYTDEYHFCIVENENEYILYGSPSDKRITALKGPFEKYEYLTAIKAIVGENGTGKTLLLQSLMLNGNTLDGIGEKYKGHTKNYVFVIEINGEKHIRYCLPDKNLTLKLSNIECNDDNLDPVLKDEDHKKLRKTVAAEGMFPNITKIFITNSMYADWASSVESKGPVTDIALSAGNFATITQMYYRNLFDLSGSVHTLGIEYEWNQILLGFVNSSKFRSICDIRYLYKNINSKMIFRNGRELRFSYFPVYEILDYSDIDYLNKRGWLANDPWSIDEKGSEAERKVIRQKVWYNAEKCRDIYSLLEVDEAKTRGSVLYLNLIFELFGYLDEKIDIGGKNDAELDKIIEDTIVNRRDRKIYIPKYFDTALCEIRRYKGFGRETYSYSENYEDYLKILELIDDSYHMEESGRVNSFVLRYINISEQPMSSGERAMLNFYSWILLFQDFSKILGNNIQTIKKDVLLMIDEMDLYLHPEWQRTFLMEFLDNIQEVLPQKKIQLIITTHSPICLSDFTKDSVTYISKNEYGSHIDSSDKHLETFGRDVYTLLDDSFYIQGTMGAISSQYIKEQLDSIKKIEKEIYSNKNYRKLSEKQTRDDILGQLEQLTDQISILGNNIVKNGLLTRIDILKEKLTTYDSDEFR